MGAAFRVIKQHAALLMGACRLPQGAVFLMHTHKCGVAQQSKQTKKKKRQKSAIVVDTKIEA